MARRADANFPKRVKDDLRDQAGSKCCRCYKPTSMANAGGDGALRIGVAAHITAASPNGPRYDPKMTPQDRRDISNGIWLCQDCAKIVDDDPEGEFTSEALHMLKEKAITAHRKARDPHPPSPVIRKGVRVVTSETVTTRTVEKHWISSSGDSDTAEDPDEAQESLPSTPLAKPPLKKSRACSSGNADKDGARRL